MIGSWAKVISSTFGLRRMTVSKTGSIVLSGEEKPAYYVDYVESDGTIFVDTGITGKSGTKGEFKMQFKEKGDLGFLETWNSSASTSTITGRVILLPLVSARLAPT